MQISDLLAQMGGASALARNLGVTPAEASRGAEALLPAILGGFSRQQAQAPAAGGLGGLLQQLGGGGLLDGLLGAQPADVNQGNNVLGEIFGSRDVSRAVAADAAGKSGLSPDMLKKMLPLLAMLVTGYMAKQHASAAPAQQAPAGGGLGGLLGGLLGGGGGGGAAGGGLGALTSILGAGGGGGGANPLEAILKQMGK